MHILALEVGTAMVSAAVLDVATAQLRGDYWKFNYIPNSPTPDAAEVPAPRLWHAVVGAARQAVHASGVAGQAGADIAGIGLTTFAPGLMLLDKSNEPLAPIWMPKDCRARPAARQVWAHVGEEFQATIGSRPLPSVISALAYRQQLSADPYLSHRVASYMHVNGWLALHMTGVKAFDPGQASATGLFDTMTDQAWSPRWCDYFEVDRAWLPPIIDGSTTVGTLRAAVASELGVPAGIPVKLGTDFLGSAMLAAAMEPGDLLHIVGATQTLAALTDRPSTAPRRWTRRLGVGPRFLHVTHNPIGSAAVTWLCRLCFRDQWGTTEFFDATLPQASQRATRITLDPPFLNGDDLEIEARRAAFRDLELTTDRLDLLAALVNAMQQRHQEAIGNLGLRESVRRTFLAGAGVPIPNHLMPRYRQGATVRGWFLGGAGVPMIRQLLPGYECEQVVILEHGPLRGVARLFNERQ